MHCEISSVMVSCERGHSGIEVEAVPNFDIVAFACYFAATSNGAKTFRVLLHSVQVLRIKAERIGKRVRIPHGRATVNDFAKFCGAKSGDLPERFCS